MSPYLIEEVDGTQNAETIFGFNSLEPKTFPLLKLRHLAEGFWWVAYLDGEAVGFAGLVPFEPFERLGVWYCKRAYTKPDHRGHGLQLRMLVTRETRARQHKATMLVSDCAAGNVHSAKNFRRAGFEMLTADDIEQPWAEASGPSLYWRKVLS